MIDQLTKEKLIRAMQELKLSGIRVRDAGRFPGNIPPEKRATILKFAETVKPGLPPLIGMGGSALIGGTGGTYTRAGIKNTAKIVARYEAGECHSLAQLATEKLLSSMESGLLPQHNVKIISNSVHTLVLLGYTSNDYRPAALIDAAEKGEYLLIDPWLAALGNDKTAGVFTLFDFPDPNLLPGVGCVYDSSVVPKLAVTDEKKPPSPIAIPAPANSPSSRLATSPSSPTSVLFDPASLSPRSPASLSSPQARSPIASPSPTTPRTPSTPSARESDSPSPRIPSGLFRPIATESKSPPPLYKAAVSEIFVNKDKRWKDSELQAFIEVVGDSKVEEAFKALGKKLPGVPKMQEFIGLLFKNGMTPGIQNRLTNDYGFNSKEIAVIKLGADVLNAASNKAIAAPPAPIPPATPRNVR